MKRDHFEKQLAPLGVHVAEYGGAVYFGESPHCSVSLAPFPTEDVQKATLAVRTPSPEERRVVVNTFLRAAGVSRTPEIADALEGRERRVWTGSQCVTVAVLDDEYIVTVAAQ